MASKLQTTVVEQCLAAPPPDTVSEFSLPLTFCDMMWIGVISNIQRLIFYECPISKSHFIDIIIPKLKNSLSLALKYFCPLAGNLILPSDSSWPQLCYTNRDSIPLVFAESDFRDFDHLVSNQARHCSDFYPLIAKLPGSSNSSGVIKIPVLALQVTLFPETGICIGISNHHAAGDGSTIYALAKAWTALSRLHGEGILLLENEYLPSYDRDVMRETKEMGDRFWKSLRDRLDKGALVVDQPQVPQAAEENVRATFLISPGDVKRLKDYVKNQRPNILHLSTFTVVCGYVWTCKIKSGNTVNETEDDYQLEYFISVADCRGHGVPAKPASYFGNCLTGFTTSTKRKQLVEEGGFPTAAELIGEAILKIPSNNEGTFRGIEEIMETASGLKLEQVCSVAGSPRQNYYDMDFGWGKPRKFEFMSIDFSGALSLSGSRDSGVLEVGLSMPRRKMDAFAAFFEEGLKTL